MKKKFKLAESQLFCYSSYWRRFAGNCLLLCMAASIFSLPAFAVGNFELIGRSYCQSSSTSVRSLCNEFDSKKDIDDKAAVFQKCLDLAELQSYYSKTADGTYKQVYVMQTPVSFPTDLVVSKFQQNVVFLARGDIYSKAIDAFFIFKSFSIEGDSAKIVFDYNYNYTSSPAALEIVVTMQKANSVWTILNTETKNR